MEEAVGSARARFEAKRVSLAMRFQGDGETRARVIVGLQKAADSIKMTGRLLRSDTNWHSILYLIRAACAMAAASATASIPNEDGIALLQETRQLLRELATDSPKAKVERGYLLGVLELARELRERRWPEGTRARTPALLSLPRSIVTLRILTPISRQNNKS
jgi:hypothetical protein